MKNKLKTKEQNKQKAENQKDWKPEENQQDLKPIEVIFLKEIRHNEIKTGIKKWEEKYKIRDLKDETKRHIYDLQQYEAERLFMSIYTRKTNIVEVEGDQSSLLNNTVEFNNKSKAKSKEGKAEN